MPNFFQQVARFFADLTASSAKRPPKLSDGPFSELTRQLLKAVPAKVRKLKLSEPISALLIYYYDTSAPQVTLELKPVSQSFQQAVCKREGRDAPFTLWSPGEEKGDLPTATIGEGEDPAEVAALFSQIRRQLSRDGQEEQTLQDYRAAIHRLTQGLNNLDWYSVCEVTDTFVVVPADGSQAFADTYEDLAGGVPEDKLELLREKDLLGPGEQWDQLPK